MRSVYVTDCGATGANRVVLTGWEILKLLGIESSLENVSIGYVGFSIKKDHGEVYVSTSNGLFRLTSTNLERMLTTGSAEELIATLDEMGYIFWRYGKRVDD